jgi:hypothetical protein
VCVCVCVLCVCVCVCVCVFVCVFVCVCVCVCVCSENTKHDSVYITLILCIQYVVKIILCIALMLYVPCQVPSAAAIQDDREREKEKPQAPASGQVNTLFFHV